MKPARSALPPVTIAFPMTCLILTAFLLCAGCAPCEHQVASVFPDAAWETATPESQGLDSARLDAAMALIAEIAEDHPRGEPSAGNTQVVCVRHGRIVWQGTDIDKVHRVHSCTKSILSACFGLLVDRGLCTPDTLAADVLPEMAEYYPDVTLGQMASFTSGYNAPWRENPLVVRPPLHAPGEGFHYSGSTNKLSEILTVVAGEPLKQLFAEGIARPIGIPDATWDWDICGKTADGLDICGGAGQASFNARQMARFGLLFLHEGRWQDRQILSRDWVRMSTRPQAAPTVTPYEPKGWYVHLPGRYGYNWWVNGRDAEGRLYWEKATPGTYAAQGNNNNYCFVIPEWDMVLVRLGNDKPIDSKLYEGVFAALRESFIDDTCTAAKGE